MVGVVAASNVLTFLPEHRTTVGAAPTDATTEVANGVGIAVTGTVLAALLTGNTADLGYGASSVLRPTVSGMHTLPVFDGAALIHALDGQRADRGLGWTDLADELHGQSAELNAHLADHSMCQGALVRTARRKTMSCQYALIILRWIRRSPEEFLTGPRVDVGDTRLPEPGPDRRLRWDLGEMYVALNAQRRERGLTWVALAQEIECTPSRLTNLRSARLADMGLSMRVTQWIRQPAAAFVHPCDW